LISVQGTASIFEIARERRYAERGINLIDYFPVIIATSESWNYRSAAADDCEQKAR